MAENGVDPFAGLNRFKPKTEQKPEALSSDIDKISRDNNFPSRQAAPETPVKRRFGASVERKQLNIRVRVDDFERFYRMAEEQQVHALGDLFTLALDALERQLSDGGIDESR